MSTPTAVTSLNPGAAAAPKSKPTEPFKVRSGSSINSLDSPLASYVLDNAVPMITIRRYS